MLIKTRGSFEIHHKESTLKSEHTKDGWIQNSYPDGTYVKSKNEGNGYIY